MTTDEHAAYESGRRARMSGAPIDASPKEHAMHWRKGWYSANWKLKIDDQAAFAEACQARNDAELRRMEQ